MDDLKRKGVGQKHINALKQLRTAHTHTVTRDELNIEELGQSLRKLREDSDITLRDMARRLGLSAAFLSDCELGRRRLSLAHALLFLKHCNI